MASVIVQAHPVEASFNATVAERVIRRERDRADGIEPIVFRVYGGDRFDVSALADTERLTFVYPTWWGSLPAALLAELVREIGPWVDGGRARNTSPLRPVRTLEVVTTHGSSKLINMLQGEPGLALWRRTVLPLCAPGARFDWRSLYGMDRIDDQRRARFLDELSASSNG